MKNKIIILIVSLLVMGSAVLIGLAMAKDKGATVSGTPALWLESEFFDWGEITSREPVTRSLMIENRGNGDLIIKGIASSCMCTTASLKTADNQTPFAGMSHSGSLPIINFKLKPGEKGELIIRYDPLAHGQPDSGLIRRAVYLRANDPQKSDVEIMFTARVNIQ